MRPPTRWPRWLQARGPAITVSSACASGATALGLGADLLRDDEADLVVAGGFDILCRFVLRGFDALRSLTRERVRPFDRRRSGLLLGEAAGLMLLARERDARGPRLGRLLGHGSASDASHIAAPDPQGRGLESAIRAALDAAGADPGDLDFVSAHGTGTPLNDRIETAVLRRVLGPRATASAGELDQGGARAHDGRGGDARGYHVSAGGAGRAPAADGRLRGARSGVWPGLRAGRLPRRPAAPDAQHLARLRRLQRRPRAGGNREDRRLRAGRGSLDRLGRRRGGAARRRAGRGDGASGDPARRARRSTASAFAARRASACWASPRSSRCWAMPTLPREAIAGPRTALVVRHRRGLWSLPTSSSSQGGRGPCTSRTRLRARSRPRSQSSSV